MKLRCAISHRSLPRFIKEGTFDHQKLFEITQAVTRNLNRIIDGNSYPVAEAKTSNLRHRPIGIVVQGLADVFILLRLPFDSIEARQLNKEIFETIYFGAMTASKDLAKIEGPYPSFPGSPTSQGVFQFDLWGTSPGRRWDWDLLKEEVMKFGIRNSLLLALMPTASTSQILGNNECFEPYTTNLYSRRVLSGEFIVVNKYLMKDLVKIGLWSEEIKNGIFQANGSIQHIPEIPNSLKQIYKTVWEIKQKVLIDMAADRGHFICQTQSLNLFMENPSYSKLTSMHFYAWKQGLKTGMYYLRSKAAAEAIKFTLKQPSSKKQEEQACSLEPDCLSCSS